MTKREQELTKENRELRKELRKWRDHTMARARHPKNCGCDYCA